MIFGVSQIATIRKIATMNSITTGKKAVIAPAPADWQVEFTAV
jgi:hypothetical protein